jgi:hypothetical protein
LKEEIWRTFWNLSGLPSRNKGRDPDSQNSEAPRSTIVFALILKQKEEGEFAMDAITNRAEIPAALFYLYKEGKEKKFPGGSLLRSSEVVERFFCVKTAAPCPNSRFFQEFSRDRPRD